jgi:uncharacterized repeat protein (TIGR03843 family)
MRDNFFSEPSEIPMGNEPSSSRETGDAPEDYLISLGESEEDQFDEPIAISIERVLKVLAHGEMEERGLLPYSSNYSFLITVDDGEVQLPAVYKPRRGENPLWDFPTGTLCLRETAAFEISHALEWNLVPPTVLREGTRGIGSVQFYIDCDPDIHYFTMREDARYMQALRRVALFDYIINNADRKSGHCLFGYDEQLWAIDHGICFHHEYKLRTVIWEFGDECIDDELLDNLLSLQRTLAQRKSELNQRLDNLINARERSALCTRLDELIQNRRYPAPLPYQRNHPWPPI